MPVDIVVRAIDGVRSNSEYANEHGQYDHKTAQFFNLLLKQQMAIRLTHNMDLIQLYSNSVIIFRFKFAASFRLQLCYLPNCINLKNHVTVCLMQRIVLDRYKIT